MSALQSERMNADLLRQRRNLLITSLVLIAINIAGATVKKDVSVLGTSIEFSNPERVILGVWIIWFYFLVRYWQYLNEEKNLGIHTKMEAWILKKLQPLINVDEQRHSITWQYGFIWKLLAQGRDNYGNFSEPKISSKNPSNPLIILMGIQAFLSVAAKTPKVTDYLIPFFLALFPPLLKLWDLISSFF